MKFRTEEEKALYEQLIPALAAPTLIALAVLMAYLLTGGW